MTRKLPCRITFIVIFLLAAVLTGKGFSAESTDQGTSSAVSPQDQGKTAQGLPADPGVLIHVYGDDSMVALFRGELEIGFFNHGLNYFSVENIPELREKVTLGRRDIKWYEIRKLVPGDTAHILVIAGIEKAGSQVLDYHGRETRMTHATFTVRAVDLASGRPAAAPEIGQFQYTPMSLFEALHLAVSPGADRMGGNIRKFWNEKVKSGN